MNERSSTTTAAMPDEVGADGDADGRPDRDPEQVELRLPAQARFLRLARLTAAGVATDAGFDVEAIEDLRVAVDELCAIAITGAQPDDILELRYRRDGDAVVVQGAIVGSALNPVAVHAIAAELLAIVSDGYDIATSDASRSFWVRKLPFSPEP